MLRTLAAVFVLLSCIPAWARDVGLLVWMQDGAALNDASKKVLMERLAAVDPARPVLVYDPGDAELGSQAYMEAVTALFQPGDNITHLVLATHGETRVINGQSLLEHMGTLGPEGVSGPLEIFLARLGARGLFSDNLHVML